MEESMITTQKQLRSAFWEAHPQFKRIRTKDWHGVSVPKTQNDYPADVRMAWCDFVERMWVSGEISPDLVARATL